LVRDPFLENSSGPLWEWGEKNPSKHLRKNLSIHINIYMEKSLKQREQLRGYLRDKLHQLSQKQPLVILLGKKENNE